MAGVLVRRGETHTEEQNTQGQRPRDDGGAAIRGTPANAISQGGRKDALRRPEGGHCRHLGFWPPDRERIDSAVLSCLLRGTWLQRPQDTSVGSNSLVGPPARARSPPGLLVLNS